MINDSKLKFLCIGPSHYEMLYNSIFHGLVSLGHEVIDYSYIRYMTKNDMTADEYLKIYGFGFTFRSTLPEERKNIDRSKENILEKINNKYFDYIIFCINDDPDNAKISNKYDIFDIVYKIYPKNRIIFLDGSDRIKINYKYDDIVVFKRELIYNTETDIDLHLYPIQFSIPESYFMKKDYSKNVFLQDNIRTPGLNNYYKFTDEEEYKQTYLNAFFGLTRKKGGWDCMRHYEIIGCECLPFFEQYNDMPITIMTKWPREYQMQSNKLYYKMLWTYKIPCDKENKFIIPEYKDLLNKFYNYAYANLSTKAMAQYVIDTVENIRRFE